MKPAKNGKGRISKNILEKINHKLRGFLRINLSKDASEVTEWFLKILDKNTYKFAIPIRLYHKNY